MRNTIDFGIDLGTTNSSVAVVNNGVADIIKNNESSECTPSAVLIDEKNRLYVGKRAKQRREFDPDDAYVEFKLQMGTQTTHRFSSSGRKMSAPELSAEVLKSLKSDVKQRTGEDLLSAVITVPAAFELPQCDATTQAAKLAGISLSPLIMEPTAAAMAYTYKSNVDRVFWLVYDFGGGTFDSAVIHIKDGNFRLVNNEGDNHLGGKLIDWEIVDSILAPYAAKEYHLDDFSRNNIKWRKAFAKLKIHAEDAKIFLSQNESVSITIDSLCKDDSGEDVPFEYELTRKQITKLAEPFIQRSVNIARKALANAKLGKDDIQKVILVGGPTLAPYLRDHLSDPTQGLGIPLEFSIDPLTVVAQGAAYFASTQRLELQSAHILDNIDVGEFGVDLEYDPVGADEEPPLGGNVVNAEIQDFSGYSIEFHNKTSQPAWSGGKIQLPRDGNFMTSLFAQRGKPNVFEILLTDPKGKVKAVTPKQFTYTIGIVPSAPPLINSVGIALANNGVKEFMAKSTPLPARKKGDFKSVVALEKNNPESEIRIPVIEGENGLADRNPLIGALIIKSNQIKRNLPAGSSIEVTLEIDESRILTTTAFIPFLDEEYSAVLELKKPVIDINQVNDEFEKEKRRLEEIQQKTRSTGDSDAERILEERVSGEDMVENVSHAIDAAGGDPDAADKAQKRLLDLRVALDDAENYLKWPALVAEAEEGIRNTRALANESKSSEALRRVDMLESEARQAIKNKNLDQLIRSIQVLSALHSELLVERPGFWVGYFQYLCEQRASMRDQSQAQHLIDQGNQALQNNDLPRLQGTVRQLIGLLPADERARAEGAHGSGVI